MMSSTKMQGTLLARKRELERQIVPLKELQEELEEVNKLLASYGRGGWERAGHENGCRCHECDPSR